MHEIVMGLEIQPKFGFHSEIHPQPRGTGLNEITRSALAREKRLLETTL